jgi:murein DD-endopeptidase MepM/ murein hydrolase activator NlpD
MKKEKYRFNPKTLHYERVNKGFGYFLKKLAFYLVLFLVLAAGFNFLFAYLFDTPKEKGLMRENNQLKVQYEKLNKKLDLIEHTLYDLKQRDANLYRMIFETEPLDPTLRDAGYGGSEKYQFLKPYSFSNLVINTANRLDQLTRKIYIQSRSYEDLYKETKEKEEMLVSIPAIMPVSNADLRRTASGFGWRTHPIYKIKKFHSGMDFTAPRGTEVYATGKGKVVLVKRSNRGYGNHVMIDHGYGYKSLYAHLNEFKVKWGQEVNRGEVIGLVGNTGTSIAPHLHYEVIRNGKKVNPINFYFNDLTPGEYERMIVLSAKSGQSFD